MEFQAIKRIKKYKQKNLSLFQSQTNDRIDLLYSPTIKNKFINIHSPELEDYH